MALTWIEDSTSQSATIFRLGRKDASTRTRVFNVIGTSNENVLHASCNQAISSLYPFWQYPGQPLVRLRAESYSVEYQGDDCWKVTIAYEKIGADDSSQVAPLKRARSFDTSGGTRHVTNALDMNNGDVGERKYGPGGLDDAASFKGAINVDDNGVNGVDIVVPALSWTESYDVPSSYVTNAYIKNIASLTGSVNKEAFRSFQPGEVLFVGASGTHEWDEQRGYGPWSLSFKFVASPNVGQTLPKAKIGDIANVEAYGHEVVWVRYATDADATKNQLVRLPVAVYCNRVYPDGDFSKIGIGVA
jgi:hypothetical protein